MKLATNRYHVFVTNLNTGKGFYEWYYGYTSRKVAEARAEEWNKLPNTKAVVIDSKNKK